MKSLKVKLCLIVALSFVFFATLGAFIGLTASANRYVNVSTNIFNLTGDAKMWAHRVENSEDEDDPYYYTMFVLTDNDDAVNYRRNLAYTWFENMVDDYDPDDEETADGSEAEDTESEKVEKIVQNKGYMRMEIGFEAVNFERFLITFETQQFNVTEDGKTTNYVVFLPAEEQGKVYAVVTSDKKVADADRTVEVPEDAVALDMDHIVIRLVESQSGLNGEFDVQIFNSTNVDEEGNPTGEYQTGIFENVGKMYAKYVSSSTKPVTPLAFSAIFAEKEEGAHGNPVADYARVALYELNKQSFVLNRNSEGKTTSTSTTYDIKEVDDGDGLVHYTGGRINDTQPPVLCLDKGLSFVTDGNELSFSYTAIDVIVQSPTTETGYFILTKAQAQDADFDPNDYDNVELFKVVKDSDDQYIYPHANHYLPVDGTDYNKDGIGTAFNSGDDADFTPTAAIKIYLKLTDTSNNGQSAYVFLDWFVEDQYKLNIGGNDYIAIATDERGATYNYDYDQSFEFEYDGKVYTGWEALVKEYQSQVDKAAEDLRAGRDDFYLPSFEKLVSDNATEYEDMTYSIYYLAGGTESQASSRSASQLSIDLTVAGKYEFTVYAHDAASNKMWYYDEDKGEIVEFGTSDIWDYHSNEGDYEGLRDKLPWFTFSAGIAEISIKDPGEQETAYVGVSYTAGSFEIEGLNTTAKYTLYRFNSENYFEETGSVLTYEQFMADKAKLFKENRKYFTNIIAASELDEDSEDYEKFSAYSWNASTRTFIPQDENAFYLIRCVVTSEATGNKTVEEFMGIAASVTPNPIKGEDTWLQDNMTSIILLSIAGAALIGIILLLVIKPKDKGDIDVQYEKEVAKKKK